MLERMKNFLPGSGPKPAPDSGITSEPDLTSEPENPAAPASVDPLEAYFERLDSAFAAIGQKDYRSQVPPLAAPPEEELLPTQAPGGPHQANPLDSHLANAFAALLAAEQGLVPLQAGALVPPVAMIPDEVIERIVERVLARMAEDPMRRTVRESTDALVSGSSGTKTAVGE